MSQVVLAGTGSGRRWAVSMAGSARYALCLLMPLVTLALLAAPGHSSASLTLFWVVLFAVEYFETGHEQRAQPQAGLLAWPFDAVLCGAFALSVANYLLFARFIQHVGLWSIEGIVGLFAMRSSSEVTIIAAHELIHRRAAPLRTMGRLMLCSLLYEHFYTEHVRGHHPRVATPEDPASARFGETFWQFFPRSVLGQFRSAWGLEKNRLKSLESPLQRLLRNRVLQGLLVEYAVLCLSAALFGVEAALALALQAAGAILSLELVNYVEHWGLVRRSKACTVVDSWDSTSAYTLYQLIGLSRHSDHHAHATRPYHLLRHHDESPKLPGGYRKTFRLALVNNRKFVELMTAELERKRLGPFADGRVRGAS